MHRYYFEDNFLDEDYQLIEDEVDEEEDDNEY